MSKSHLARGPAKALHVSILALIVATAGISSVAIAKPHKETNAELQAQIMARTQQMLDDQKAQFQADEARKQAQIDALQTQVDILSAQLKTTQTQVASTPVPPTVQQVVDSMPKQDTSVSMKKGTATVASSDGAFILAVHGVIQADAASYDQSKTLPAGITGAARDLNSGTNFRRARFGFNGKLYSNFDYNLVFDFAGAGAEDVGRVHEAWVQYSGFKSAKIRLGEFAPSVGLGDAGSTNASPFLERASPSELARTFGGGDTRMGVAVFNATDRWLYSAALTGNTVSTLNTQATGFTAANFDEQTGIAARVAGTPFRGFDWLVHAGINYSAVINPADLGASASPRSPIQLRDRPELRVDGTRLVDTGAINAQSAAATGVELGGQYKDLYVAGEAFHYQIERLGAATGVTNPDFSGWYVEGGWALTGEGRKYNTQTAAFDGIVPHDNFDPINGKWGAFELVGRLSSLDLNYHQDSLVAGDRVRGGKQDIATIGLNWQLNSTIRFVFEGQNVKIERLNTAGADIGQKYSTFAARSQFSF